MARRDDELERLRKENRELKSLNRQLLKQVKKLNKGYRKLDEEVEEEELETLPKEDRCSNCGGAIKTIELSMANKKKKTLRKCQDCGTRY